MVLACLLLFPVCLYYLLLRIDIRRIISQDFHRWIHWKGLPCSLLSFSLLFAQYPEFRSVVYKRIGWCQLFVCWLLRGEHNLSLACNCIGPGLVVQHGYSTIVCAHRIGKNFHVNQCVNIVWNGNEQCTIGDNVTVCVGAIIVGGVTIGNDVTVGAGAVVVKDVPDNSLVVGNPMRIIPR